MWFGLRDAYFRQKELFVSTLLPKEILKKNDNINISENFHAV